MRNRLKRGAIIGALLTVLFAGNNARAEDKLKLLIWINGDKGYNGLQKVGDAFINS